MTTSRAVFSAVVLVTAALGSAGPAWADEPPTPDVLDGTYTYSDGISTQQWICHAHVDLACINIEASPAAGKPGFSGQATNFRGWTLTVEGLPDVVKCSDGSTAAGGMNFRWDAQLDRLRAHVLDSGGLW